MSALQGILYEEPSAWLFLLVTVVMGGWAGWMAARGIARGWRPFWHCALALLLSDISSLGAMRRDWLSKMMNLGC